MQDKTSIIEPLFEKIEAYAKSSFELLRLKTLDKIATLSTALVSKVIMIFFLTMFLLLANVGLALWLGDLLGKTYYGFFCVALFYALLGGVLCIIMKNYIKTRINEIIVSQLLN